MSRAQAERLAWTVAAFGLIGAIAGWAVAPGDFPHAWLAALVAWIGWPLGCLALLLIHVLTGGRWGNTIRQQLAAGLGSLWLLPLALIPLLVVLPGLYPWLRPDTAAKLPNGFYLNGPFLLLRTIVYLAVWLGLTWLVQRALRQRGSEAALARMAPAALILLAITVTFAAVDATMSLEPQFASSAYGLIEMAEMGLFALSVSLLAAVLAQAWEADGLEALGELLMALVILRAYLDFVQFLIVWQSNLPSEAQWYLPRTTGGWGMAASLLALCHFVLPFVLLLSPRVRRSPWGIAAVAGVLVLGTVIRSWWLVLPASGRGLGVLDVLTMLGVLGAAAAMALSTPAGPRVPGTEGMRSHA
jgi:hypothetical protein